MKKDHYAILFIFIIICVILEIGFTWYFLIQKSKLHKTEVTLNISTFHLDDNKEITKLSEESLENLKKILSEEPISKLTEDFEKERTFYTNFITIITILLTIIGLVPVFYGIFEKNENAKLREDIEIIKNEYGKQLDDIKVNNMLDSIKNLTDALKGKTSLLINTQKKVENISELEHYIAERIEESFKGINISTLCENYMYYLSIIVFNLFSSIVFFSKHELQVNLVDETNGNVCINTTPILKTILTQIKVYITEENYKKMIDNMKLFPDRRFDFSDL